MDINELAVEIEREEAGTLVHVKDMAGELQYYGNDNKPVTIRVAGSYSRRFTQARDAQRNGNMRRGSRPLSSEDITRQAVKVIAGSVISWDGFTSQGEPYPCTQENAVAVLNAAPWIRESLEEAMSNHANFTGAV